MKFVLTFCIQFNMMKIDKILYEKLSNIDLAASLTYQSATVKCTGSDP